MTVFFETERYNLIPLSRTHLNGNYIKWFNDGEVCDKNSHHRWVMSVAQLEDYVDEISKSKTSLVLAIHDKISNEHIGNISLQSVNFIDRNAEIAWIIGEKKYWRSGCATEVAIPLINHAFKQINLKRLYLGTADNNIGMKKVADKLGFVQEGIRRKALYKNGEYHDVIEYGLLREDWKY